MAHTAHRNQQTKCAELAQTLLPVQHAYASMIQQKDAFLVSPYTQKQNSFPDGVATFEKALLEHQKRYKGSAKNLVDQYLQRFNIGVESTDTGVTIDPTDGRAVLTARIDLRNSKTDYFPALVKKIVGTVDFGTKNTSVPFLEEIDGLMMAHSTTKFRANRLKKVKHITCFAEGTVELMGLEEAEVILLRAQTVLLPALKTASYIESIIYGGKKPLPVNLNLPELTKVDSISWNTMKSLSIPKVIEINSLYAPQAKRIYAPSLEKVKLAMDISNLDPNIPFRTAFEQLIEIGSDLEGVSLYVKDEARMKEISQLRWNGLTWNGGLAISSRPSD